MKKKERKPRKKRGSLVSSETERLSLPSRAAIRSVARFIAAQIAAEKLKLREGGAEPATTGKKSEKNTSKGQRNPRRTKRTGQPGTNLLGPYIKLDRR